MSEMSLTLCFNWYSLPDSNRCYRRERVAFLTPCYSEITFNVKKNIELVIYRFSEFLAVTASVG